MVWYRGHDLRTDDHPALLAASQRGGPVVPLFIWDPSTPNAAAFGAVKTWWLRKSLTCLDSTLSVLGVKLHTLCGSNIDQIISFLQLSGADAVFWNRCYEPEVITRDENLRATLRENGYLAESFKAELLVEPWELSASDVSPRFDSFNAYMRAWMRLPPPADPIPSPSRLKPPVSSVDSVGIQNIGLNTPPEIDKTLSKHWTPGSRCAEKQLVKFLNELFPNFCESRHRRHMNGTSRLSPHIRFGEISPRRIYAITRKYVAIWKKEGAASYYEKDIEHLVPKMSHPRDTYSCLNYLEGKETAVGAALNAVPTMKSGRRNGSIQVEVQTGTTHDNVEEIPFSRFPTNVSSTRRKRKKLPSLVPKRRIALSARMFLKNLCLRDFAFHVLHHFPKFNSDPLLPEFSSFPWAEDNGSFERWLEGMTGYPFLDAAMRQLRSTGWIPNGMRFLLATFLTKNLLLPWAKGLQEFYSLLVDGDHSANALGWQWTVGCNTDSFPLRLLVNPVRIGYLQDPTGAFVRKWVPELRHIPTEYIHEPWKASPEVLKNVGASLDQRYPKRIILMSTAKKRMQRSIWHMKKMFASSGVPRLMLFDRERSVVKEVPDEQVDLLNLDDPVPISQKHSLFPSLWSLLVRCDSSSPYMCERSPSPEPVISLDSANLDESALEISLETGSIEQEILSSGQDDHEHENQDSNSFRRTFNSPFSSADRAAPRLTCRTDADALNLTLLDSRLPDSDENGAEGASVVVSASAAANATEPNKMGRNVAETDFLEDAYHDNPYGVISAPDTHVHQTEARSPPLHVNHSTLQQLRPAMHGLDSQPSSKRVRRSPSSPDPNDIPAVTQPPFQGSPLQDVGLEGMPPFFKSYPHQPLSSSALPYPPIDHNIGHVAVGTCFNQLNQQHSMPFAQNVDIVPGSNGGMMHVGTGGMSNATIPSSVPTPIQSHTGIPVSTNVNVGARPITNSATAAGHGGAPGTAFCTDPGGALYAQQLNMIQFYGVPPVMPMMGQPTSPPERPDVFSSTIVPNGVQSSKFGTGSQIPGFIPMGYGLYGNGMMDNSLMQGPSSMNGTNYPTTSGIATHAPVPGVSGTGPGPGVPDSGIGGDGFAVGSAPSLVPQSLGFGHQHMGAAPAMPSAPIATHNSVSMRAPNRSLCLASGPAAPPTAAPTTAHEPMPSTVVTSVNPPPPVATLSTATPQAPVPVSSHNQPSPSQSPIPAPTPSQTSVQAEPVSDVRFAPASSNANPIPPVIQEPHQRQQHHPFSPTSPAYQSMPSHSQIPAPSSGIVVAPLDTSNQISTPPRLPYLSVNNGQISPTDRQISNHGFGAVGVSGLAQQHCTDELTRNDANQAFFTNSSFGPVLEAANTARATRMTRTASPSRQQMGSDINRRNEHGEISNGMGGSANWGESRHENELYSDRSSEDVVQNEEEIERENPVSRDQPNTGVENGRGCENEFDTETEEAARREDGNGAAIVSDSSSPLPLENIPPSQGATANAGDKIISEGDERSIGGIEADGNADGSPVRTSSSKIKQKDVEKSVSKRPRNRKETRVNGSIIKKSKRGRRHDNSSSRSIGSLELPLKKLQSQLNGSSSVGVNSSTKTGNNFKANGSSSLGANLNSPRRKGKTKVKLKGNGLSASGSGGIEKVDDMDLGEEPTCLIERENRLSRILARSGHEYQEFARYIMINYELTDKTDRQNSKDYVRLCNLKDDYHRQCDDQQTKLKIYRIKSFFSNILKLEVTGEWDRHNHGGVRGPYVYGIRLRTAGNT